MAIFSHRNNGRRKLSEDELLDVLAHVWIEEFTDELTGLCILCGNKGVVDTRSQKYLDQYGYGHLETLTFVSGPVGQRAEGVAHCICPNGRRLKSLGHPLP